MSWIAVGLSEDVPPGVAVPACVDGTDLAIWRSRSGAVHAWGDRCPHRGMRLSHGFVRGEHLACIYHGWQYRADGTCAHIPAHPKLEPPATICAETHACQELSHVIWISLSPNETAPEPLLGQRPIRSLPVERSADDVALGFGAALGSRRIALNEATLLLQPVSPTGCMVHAMAPQDRDPREASRWLEEQRNRLEEKTR